MNPDNSKQFLIHIYLLLWAINIFWLMEIVSELSGNSQNWLCVTQGSGWHKTTHHFCCWSHDRRWWIYETIIARKSNGFAELTKNEQYIPPHRPGKVQTNHTSWLVAEWTSDTWNQDHVCRENRSGWSDTKPMQYISY